MFARLQHHIVIHRQVARPMPIVDPDRFKRIDDCGRAAGDARLRAVGEGLRRETRDTDLAGRWGPA